ncbi:ankyrin repeat domain-containing protein [Candidatus Dependentiae bacterium]
MKKNILVLSILAIAILSLQKIYSKIDPKTVLSKKEYALYKAAYMGRTKKVTKLAKEGTDVNVKSPNSKRTPLHIAASKGKLAIVRVLVESGAQLEPKNIDGKTPLHFAAEKGRVKIVEYLVERGAAITKEIIDCAKKELIRNILENKLNGIN